MPGRATSLTRSVKDLCELLERFERAGVALISVAESLDTSSAAGRLVLNIMTAVSQWQREAIGERTRDALSQKRRQSERLGNIAYGDRLAADGVHVEADEAEQAILERIRGLYRNQTLRAIARDLNDRGLHTRRGSAWRHEYIARVLSGQAREQLASVRRCQGVDLVGTARPIDRLAV